MLDRIDYDALYLAAEQVTALGFKIVIFCFI